MIDYTKKLEKLFDVLWPLNRSITGDGVRQTHHEISKIISIKTSEIHSGKKVYDWTVPDEWNPIDAYMLDENGKKIIDFKKNNLHLLNYSQPFQGFLSFDKLKKHLFFDKKNPSAIPYKTSYYKKNWGLCLSYNEFKKLKKRNYFIFINVKFSKGSITFSELLLPGKSKKEILIHSYTCHPSLAVNELTGPIFATYLAKELSLKKDRFFSYRFVFTSETIGTITYINKKERSLKKNVVAGLVLTCLGIKNYITFKKSRNQNSLINLSFIDLKNYLKKKNKVKVIEFSPSGSDERQYCSLGIDLPIATFMSKKCGEYKEYHTSLDNKSIVSFKDINNNIKIFQKLFHQIEKNFKKENYSLDKNMNIDKKFFIKKKNKITKYDKIFPLIKITKCEPHLSKWKIHYETKDHKIADAQTHATKWLVHFADGKNSIDQIAKISKIKPDLIYKISLIMKKSKLLMFKNYEYKQSR
jgi:aminopeptidase-like protein